MHQMVYYYCTAQGFKLHSTYLLVLKKCCYIRLQINGTSSHTYTRGRIRYLIYSLSLSLSLSLSSACSCKVQRSSGGLEITSTKTKASVTFEPFQMEFYINNEIAVVLNTRGLMNFEHYRNKRFIDFFSPFQYCFQIIRTCYRYIANSFNL